MFMETDKHLYDCLTICQFEKKYIWNWSKIGIFLFLLTFFVETLDKSINYCQSVPLDHLLICIHYENCMSGFSAFFLNLSKSDNILFRSMSNGNFLFSSASIVIGRYLGENSLVHELRVMAAVELHANATYAQGPALNEIRLWKKPTSNLWFFLILEKIQTGQGEVVEDVEFPGVFKK